MMNDALRKYLAEADHPVTAKVLRQILREEIPEYVAASPSHAKRPARRRTTG